MPNKFHRQNFRAGTNPFSKKSNIQKIAEVFGVKKDKVKKDKKPKKRMMAKGGSKPDFLDIDKEVRQQRVTHRNLEKGTTYQFDVSPADFEFMETWFEPLTSAERKIAYIKKG